jgi:Periplasmic copper-binding protein (NosD)
MGQRWAILVAVAVLALAIAGGISYAQDRANAGGVSCGDTITADTTLDNDLIDCPNNGIVIGADDITLDLNGHAIDGDGTPAAGCDLEVEFCDTGVAIEGHDGVTVTDGSVREFLVGVWGVEVSHTSLLGISSKRNHGSALGFFGGTRSVVRNSSGSRSVRTDEGEDGQGMFLIDSHHVRVTHSSFRRNRDLGILVGLPGFESTHNVIKGNELSRNGSAGIIFEQGDRNRVRRNRSLRDGEGIIVGPGSGNEIARNRIFRSRGNGIAVEKGRGNLVARNVVRRAGKVGIRLALEGPLIGGGHNTVRRNQVRGGGGDGVLVDTKDRHSLLRRNHARNNGDDGFDVRSRSAKLTRNGARRNRELGIDAVPGVTDGGRNRQAGTGMRASA